MPRHVPLKERDPRLQHFPIDARFTLNLTWLYSLEPRVAAASLQFCCLAVRSFSGGAPMTRSITVLFLVMLATGCVHRKPVTPQLAARHCPKDSLPYQAVYNGVLLNHGELCMAISPVTNKPMGVFPVQAYNPYTETDMDQDEGDKKPDQSAWRKFWLKKKDTD
jgi:hypothetical protein